MLEPRVVLDTNIFVSATFWKGKPYKIIHKALDKNIKVFVSKNILNELAKVLKRDFETDDKHIREIIDAYALFTGMVEPKEKINVIKEDPDDNMILECAVACKADFIVTQDKHLLKLKKYRKIKITTPNEFLDLI